MATLTQPSLLSDMKTGFRIGGLPLATMVIAVVATDMSQMTVSHIFTGDINGSLANEVDTPSGFFWSTLAISFCHLIAVFLAYRWLLTIWLRTEFDPGTQPPQNVQYSYVACHQFLSLLSCALILLPIAIPFVLLVHTFLSLAFYWALRLVNSPNTLYLNIFLMFALKLAIVFFVHFVASYLYVRFSTGLGATAKTGTPVKFGKFYAICGQTAPRGSAMKTAAKLAWLLMLVSFTIISTATGLAFVFVPEHVEVWMYGGLPIFTDTANAPLLMHFLNSAVNGLIYVCIGTAIAAAMIQFFRKLVVPDTTLETTGAG